MRKTTKLAALLLAVMMIVSCIPMMASAESANTIEVGIVNVAPNATATVPVTITGAACAVQFKVDFAGLTLTDVDDDAFDGIITTTLGTDAEDFGLIVEAAGAENFTAATFNLVFTAPAAEGTYDITVSDVDASDVNENTVEFDITNGAVAVAAAPVGPTEIAVTYNHSISLNSSIATNIYVLKNDELASCANLYMEITKEFFDAEGNMSTSTSTVNVTSMTPVNLSGALRYQFVYGGLDARELANNFTGYVYGTDADGKVIYKSSNADSYSLLTYCKNNFTKTNEAFKVVLADLLVYGSAAQVAFPYNVNNLSKDNAEVSSYVATYATATDVELSAVGTHTGDQTIQISNSVDCESTIRLICAVKKTDVASYNFADLKLEIAYDGKTVEYTSDQFGNVASDSYYRVYFDQLLSTQLSTPVEITLYSGDTAISKTRTYSIEAYCLAQINKTTSTAAQKTLYQKMMNYGYTCADYFG